MLSTTPRRTPAARALTLLLAGSLVLTSAQPSYSQSWVPLLFQGLQVIQLSNLSERQEVGIGKQVNQELIRSRKIRLSRNAALQQEINRIGQRLAAASSRPNIPYTFQVVEDRSVNAFATMGGFVYVNTGLIARAENEAELASVIAHEISHITERHAVNQMRNAALSQGLMSAAGINRNTMVQLGVQLAFNLPYSREAESEADRLGLKTLQEAGYAPIAMVNFMKKLARQGQSAPEFLSTHPNSTQRVAAISREINPATAYEGDGLDAEAYQQNILAFFQRPRNSSSMTQFRFSPF
jgi:predicted Zn-dependent protease